MRKSLFLLSEHYAVSWEAIAVLLIISKRVWFSFLIYLCIKSTKAYCLRRNRYMSWHDKWVYINRLMVYGIWLCLTSPFSGILSLMSYGIWLLAAPNINKMPRNGMVTTLSIEYWISSGIFRLELKLIIMFRPHFQVEHDFRFVPHLNFEYDE